MECDAHFISIGVCGNEMACLFGVRHNLLDGLASGFGTKGAQISVEVEIDVWALTALG
jgi:hypothetical protein